MAMLNNKMVVIPSRYTTRHGAKASSRSDWPSPATASTSLVETCQNRRQRAPFFSTQMLNVWYIQNRVILFGQMLVNIPAPWSIWGMNH